jgi:methanethiol S-methyltransferase
MRRWLAFGFGVSCHLLFLLTFAYMCGFVGNFLVPRSIDAPLGQDRFTPLNAGLVDLALLLAFAVPHSVMARPAFKRRWTRIVPQHLERSIYVLTSCALMILLLCCWQPISHVLWDVRQPGLRILAWGAFFTGWLLVPLASLMISHFDLFGTRQVWLNLRGQPYSYLMFGTPWLYRLVRHPLYVGWITAFWATPTMSVGHLLFACTLTLYMLAAIPIEERDLVNVYGDRYERYRQNVPMLVPRILPQAQRFAGAVDPESAA